MPNGLVIFNSSEYQHGSKTDLALLKRLQQQGIPVVTVFLTGRPLWVNKELNASDAFVVAWLPGSEGQGIADLLLRDPQGKIQHDFHGKLSFSWPRTDQQFVLNHGDKTYDPLFAYGYGLTYADRSKLPVLSEQVSAATAVSADTAVQPLFLRNLAAGMAWVLADSSQPGTLLTSPSGISADGQSLAMQSVNLSYQEDGRQFRWNSKSPATASLRYIKATTVSNASTLSFKLRFDQQVPANLSLGVLCDQAGRCQRQLSLTAPLAKLTAGVWHSVAVSLNCTDRQITTNKVTDALLLRATGQHSLAVADIVLTTATSPATVQLDCMP